MLNIKSYNKNDVDNIIIRFFNITENFNKYDDTHPVINIEKCTYIDSNNICLKLRMLSYTDMYNGNVELFIINKYNQSEYHKVNLTNFYDIYEANIYIYFEIKRDNNEYKFKIPKIIHQSYKYNYLHVNNYVAVHSWRSMNLNYEYKYWNDNDIKKFIKENFDMNVLKAYDMLYAGAYKSDIFRLCVLYIHGGIWTDISSICEYPLDLLIDKSDEFITCKDTPSQVTNPNIYQAFIVVNRKNSLLKSILYFIVDRVINNNHYNKLYKHLNADLGITGPTIFALATNIYMYRPIMTFFEEGTLFNNDSRIRLLNHIPGSIYDKNITIVKTKYTEYDKDRYNYHYSYLYNKGYVYKTYIPNSITISNLNIYQCWIQSNYVTHNMEKAINTWKHHYSGWNYKLITEDLFLKDAINDIEFPTIINVYNSIKPYAYKSDILRLYYLYKTGGIYADIDSVCLNSCIGLYNNYDLILCIDMDENSISNGFICSKNKNNKFLKKVLDKIIYNIENKLIMNNDLSLTGPVLFGYIFEEYYNIKKPFKSGYYMEMNDGIKLLNYSSHLPLPGGSWYESCINSRIVEGNILETYANKGNGDYVYNRVTFNLNDLLVNEFGIIKNNTSIEYDKCDGCGLVYDVDSKIVLLSSKYKEYNEERIILDGNDFAKMYRDGDIYN